MITDAVFILAAKLVDLFILIHQDVPPERRRESWERWYKMWEPVWKKVGLEINNP